jgi:Transcriptional regulator
MNFLGIEAFLTIVETGSLTKAAESLYLSQSTVSHRLKALERELNTTLIERKKGHQVINLTPKGEEFVPIAERWLALWKDTCILQNTEPRLSLSIGCVDSLSTYMFPPLYKQILNHEISIDLQVRTHQSGEIYNLLDNREIDVGFVLRQIINKNIIIEPILNEKMVLIQRTVEDIPEHAVHPSELDSKNEFFLDWNPSYRAWHDFWWDSTKRPHAHIDTASLILNLMDDPKYWAIVPISMANAFKKITDFQVYDILEPPPNRIVYKIIHRYPKPSSINSIRILDEYLKTFKNSINILL